VARLLQATLRPAEVQGLSHLKARVDSGQATMLCIWHQRLSYTAGWLLGPQDPPIKPGFLVSPSRDGELIAAVVAGYGADVLRGSANRTGARALRDLYGLIQGGAWPVLHPDGPHGPPREVKTGTLTLAQMTRAALLPISFSADRYWQFGSWDALILPKPFARVVIHIGEPVLIDKRDAVEDKAALLGERLTALDSAADAQMGVTPRAGRRRRL